VGAGHRGDGSVPPGRRGTLPRTARARIPPAVDPVTRAGSARRVARATRACGRGRHLRPLVGVLVREEDVGQLRARRARALAPARRLAQREPSVDQDARRAGRPTQRELPRCRWTGRTGALNGCSSTLGRLQERRERSCFLQAARCATRAPCPHEKIHQEPQQGEEQALKRSRPVARKAAPRNARAIDRRISGPSSDAAAGGGLMLAAARRALPATSSKPSAGAIVARPAQLPCSRRRCRCTCAARRRGQVRPALRLLRESAGIEPLAERTQ